MLHRQRWMVGAVVVFMAFVFGLPVTQAQTATPTIQPTTMIVAAGKTITFTGGGFARGERVATWTTAPDQTVFSGPFVYAARADGTVEISFDVPGEARGGRWGFTAYGDRSRTPAVTNFDVEANASSTNQPQDTVAPPAGTAGTEFRFNVYGYSGSERISYWVTGPDGEVFEAFPDKKEADTRGKASVQWTAPVTAARGVWVMTVQGIKTGRAKALRFEVQ